MKNEPMVTHDIISIDFRYFLRENTNTIFFISGQRFTRSDINRIPSILERLRGNATQQTIECNDKTIDGVIAAMMLRAESVFCFNIHLETYS